LGTNLKMILVLKHSAGLSLVVEGCKGRKSVVSVFPTLFRMLTASYLFVLLGEFISIAGLLNMCSYADQTKDA